MKKRTAYALLLAFVLFLTACSSTNDAVVNSPGKYVSKEFYTSGGWQDFTDYAKFTYKKADLKDNPYFQPLNSETIATFSSYLDDFENWVKTVGKTDAENKLVLNYDFDRSLIAFENYIYIDDKSGHLPYSNYDLYLFDTKNNTLYYFHNNI